MSNERRDEMQQQGDMKTCRDQHEEDQVVIHLKMRNYLTQRGRDEEMKRNKGANIKNRGDRRNERESYSLNL